MLLNGVFLLCTLVYFWIALDIDTHNPVKKINLNAFIIVSGRPSIKYIIPAIKDIKDIMPLKK